MPAIAALTIADGADTPVNHTFSPVTTDGSSAQWADRSPASPAGFLKLNHEVLNPATPSAAYRVKIGLNVPVMATIDGVPTVVRNSSAQVIFNFSTQSGEQEREDLLAYIKNYLGVSAVKDAIVQIEPFY